MRALLGMHINIANLAVDCSIRIVNYITIRKNYACAFIILAMYYKF